MARLRAAILAGRFDEEAEAIEAGWAVKQEIAA
jgi:hypothetical protein